MHLYFVRHGESFVNLKDWDKGNTDEGLTPLGQRQAAALAKWLPDEIEAIDALYVSSMRRAQETAVPIAQKLRYETVHAAAMSSGPTHSIQRVLLCCGVANAARRVSA